MINARCRVKIPFASGTREFCKLQVFLASNSTLLVALQIKVMVGTLGDEATNREE
jgi:hypothetical protein